MKYLSGLVYIAILLFFSSVESFAQQPQQPIPTGRAIDLPQVLLLSESIGGFLLVLGGILAGITVIVSGIMYFMAGSNAQAVGNAKKVLLGGIIGSFIIFGSGMIIATIRGFAENPLFFFR